MIFFDTESVGFFGPTVLIQYCVNDGPAIIHDIWDNRVIDTLNLIENHCNDPEGVVGFNLTHDWFHYTKTYNIFKELPLYEKPDPLDYLDVSVEAHDKYCLRPVKACDLMIVGRRTKFQASLNQKKITLKKVPSILAELLLKELKDRVKIPSIYFARGKRGYQWRIVPLIKGTNTEATATNTDENTEIDPDFVNIALTFAPSTSLKNIMAFLGHDVTTLDDLPELTKPEEYSWWPDHPGWINVFREHLYEWRNDPRRIEYARNDPLYTRELWHYLDRPEPGDRDSELACAVGGIHWKGYRVDLKGCKERKAKLEIVAKSLPININSPKQVKKWLHESASPLEQQVIQDTRQETIHKIASEWVEDNPELALKCQKLLDARQADSELDLLDKLLKAGRLYTVFKISGTKSNRMSGGNESYIKTKGGSINPQGIKKGGEIRSLFLLAFEDQQLDGGDFTSFEVSIAEAEYKDPLLRKDLLSGKKIHALFGAEMYNMSYEEVLATSEKNKNDPEGYYSRAKTGFFATLYWAFEEKIGQAMWISTEQAKKGLESFENKYSRIKESKKEILSTYSAMVQPNGIGTAIEWREPKEYVESFLGFKRFFTLEINIMRSLFSMAQNPSEELKEIAKGVKVMRRDRIQTAGGALASALYALAFSIQSKIFRAAANHKIQSPGAELNKGLQKNIWDIQPIGVGPWLVVPLNIHDEIQVPCKPEVSERVKEVVEKTVKEYRKLVPLIGMDWKQNLKNWGEK